ncbi:MAG: LytTR family transcriptional regulator DNA-binding domain-containing protein [Bacteroidota bacterium]
MRSLVVHWLNKPYPRIESLKWQLILVIGIGVFVSIFLFIYQPYGASEIKENQYLFLAGFGLCVSLVLTFTYLVLPRIFPNFFAQDDWQIRKEVLFLLITFLIISLLNYAYNSTVGANIAPQHTPLEFVGITVSIGIFPLIILIFLVELYLNSKNATEASKLSKIIKPNSNPADSEFTIVPETIKSKPLTLTVSQFIFAKSDNNYATFYFSAGGKVEKQLVRVGLKNVENQVNDYPFLVRCHNSYLINVRKVSEVKGNARSLYVYLEGYDTPIPISRNFDRQKLLG